MITTIKMDTNVTLVVTHSLSVSDKKRVQRNKWRIGRAMKAWETPKKDSVVVIDWASRIVFSRSSIFSDGFTLSKSGVDLRQSFFEHHPYRKKRVWDWGWMSEWDCWSFSCWVRSVICWGKLGKWFERQLKVEEISVASLARSLSPSLTWKKPRHFSFSLRHAEVLFSRFSEEFRTSVWTTLFWLF